MSRLFVRAMADPLNPDAPIAIYLDPHSGEFTALARQCSHEAVTLHDLESSLRRAIDTTSEPWHARTTICLPTPLDHDHRDRSLLQPTSGWYRRVVHGDDTDLTWVPRSSEDTPTGPPDDAEEDTWALGPVPPLPTDATTYLLRGSPDQASYPTDPERDTLLRQLDHGLTALHDVLNQALASSRLPTPALLADLTGGLQDATNGLAITLAHHLPEAE